MTYSICLGQDFTYYLGRRDGAVFMCFLTMVLLQKKHIFQCRQCKMQTLDCSPGVKMQTEGKMPTEVLLSVSSKQTSLIKATRSESLHLGLALIALGLD